jgi:hypothetical protein
MRKIDGETTLEEVLKLKGAREILQKYDFPCIFCPLAAPEKRHLKLGKVAKAYGIEIKELLEDLNELRVEN